MLYCIAKTKSGYTPKLPLLTPTQLLFPITLNIIGIDRVFQKQIKTLSLSWGEDSPQPGRLPVSGNTWA